MYYSKARLEYAGKNWLNTPSSKSGHGCQLCLTKFDMQQCVKKKNLDRGSLPDLIGFRYGTGSCDGSVALVCLHDVEEPTLRKRLNSIKLGEYRYLLVHESQWGNRLLSKIPDNWGVIICKRDTKFKTIRGAVDDNSIGFNKTLFDAYRHRFDFHDEETLLLSYISIHSYHQQAETIREMETVINDLERDLEDLKSEREALRKNVREMKTQQYSNSLDLDLDIPQFLNP